MLADIPTAVPTVSTFTQLMDVVPPLDPDALAKGIMSIPVNIQRGRPDSSKIKDLFNLSDLDRPPEPIVQTPPQFPYELRTLVTEASVRIGFIVTSKGDVVLPYVIASSHKEVERPALEAVLKWKFRPGVKNGRKVNTRVEQPINFSVTQD
jgi:protein TonB